MSKAKGTTLVALVKFLRSQRERALAALPPSLHAYLDERIQASSWYPEADLLSLIRVMVAMIPGRRDVVLAQLGVALARCSKCATTRSRRPKCAGFSPAISARVCGSGPQPTCAS